MLDMPAREKSFCSGVRALGRGAAQGGCACGVVPFPLTLTLSPGRGNSEGRRSSIQEPLVSSTDWREFSLSLGRGQGGGSWRPFFRPAPARTRRALPERLPATPLSSSVRGGMSDLWTVRPRHAAPDGAWPPRCPWAINMALHTELRRGGGRADGFGAWRIGAGPWWPRRLPPPVQGGFGLGDGFPGRVPWADMPARRWRAKRRKSR
jgi:hypothetical protein